MDQSSAMPQVSGSQERWQLSIPSHKGPMFLLCLLQNLAVTRIFYSSQGYENNILKPSVDASILSFLLIHWENTQENGPKIDQLLLNGRVNIFLELDNFQISLFPSYSHLIYLNLTVLVRCSSLHQSQIPNVSLSTHICHSVSPSSSWA